MKSFIGCSSPQGARPRSVARSFTKNVTYVVSRLVGGPVAGAAQAANRDEREENSKSGIPGLRQIKFLGDLFGRTDGTKQRTELIIFIRPQLIRDGVDARQVAEEFRDRLDSMRAQGTMVRGTGLGPGPVTRNY